MQGAQFKLTYQTEAVSELFDLKEDPYEANNLEGTGRIEEKALTQHIVSRIDELRAGNATPAESVDPATIEHLKSLGYIQ